MSHPTPETLDQAIEFLLCVGPLDEIKERAYHTLRDYLAQRFGAAILMASPEEADKLMELFNLIVKR